MNAVWLIEFGPSADACWNGGHERGVALCGGITEGLADSACLLRAQVWRRFHSDQYHRHITGLRAFDDVRQILPHLGYRQSAQSVVAAQFQNQKLDVSRLQRPINAPSASR